MFDQLTTALRFFTRLPFPGKAGDHTDLSSAAIWFPIAGLFVGLVTGIVWLVTASFLPANVAAGLAIGLGILITGGLHEDGFADCADGLGGGFTRERALEIMRDSRIGVYGGIAIVLTIGLRWAALASFGWWQGFAALIIAHSVSRAAITLPMALTGYARPSGLGQMVSAGISRNELAIIIAIAAAISLLIGGFGGIIAAAIALLLAWLFTRYLDHRLGGYTGDGLGATQQIAEIASLIVLAASLS